MGRLTARECLAVLEERISNLAARFDRFEENQQKLVDQIMKNARSINDLSHSVKLLMDERSMKKEIDTKWKLMISSTFISFILYVVSEIITKVI